MDYKAYSEELMQYLILGQRLGNLVNGNISEIAKGELAVLIYLLDENDGASAIEISQRFQVNSSRVAATLNSLSKKGYIERKNNPYDKRKIQVFITEKGKEFSESRKNDVLIHIERILKELGDEDTKEYLRIMRRVSEIYQNISQ